MAQSIKAPAGAVAFKLQRLHEQTGRNKESGRRYKTQRPEQLYGEPDEQGRMVDAWSVKGWSVAAVRDSFGPGHYRVDFFDASGKKVGGESFRVAGPAPGASKATGARASADASPLAVAASGSLASMSALELITFLDERDRRAGERASASAEAAVTRDREFYRSLLESRAASPATSAGAAAPVDSERERDLLMREMDLKVREKMLELESKHAQEMAALRAELDDGDDGPYVPPKNVSQAASRVGIALIGELEEQMPAVIGEAIPAMVDWLKTKGFKPSDELKTKIRTVRDEQRATSVASSVSRAVRGTNGASTNGAAHREPDDDAADTN